MAPPPIPFFSGRQISAGEIDGLVAIRPKAGLAFTEPPGTSVLYVPIARLVSLAVLPLDQPGWSALELRGDFHRVERGRHIRLAPLPDADAHALARALTTRYHLPLRPRPHPAFGLADLDWDDLVSVVGTYKPGHFEAADFEGVMLDAGRDVAADLVSGERYHVVGFLDPGAAPGSLVVGYRGATLRALHVQRDHLETPCPLCDPHHPRGPRELAAPSFTLRARTMPGDQGARDLEFLHRDAADAATFALLVGTGAQKTCDLAADAARRVLGALLDEPVYGPIPRRATPPRNLSTLDLAPWLGHLLDRSPLPADPGGRLRALGQRIGDVFRVLNERGTALSASGFLGRIDGARLTLVRRGLARAYLVRDRSVDVLVHEHSLGREYAAAGHEAPAEVQDIPLSSFELPSDDPPRTFELAAGDLLVLLSGAALRRECEPRLAALLAARDLDAVARELDACDHPDWPRGWGLLALELARPAAPR